MKRRTEVARRAESVAEHLAAPEYFLRKLKERGLKVTRTRVLVIGAFLEAGGHVDVESLHEAIREKSRAVSRITVYRTLRELVSAGLARANVFETGATIYENAWNTAHHDHLICESCGRSVEFLDERIERLQDALVAKHGFKPLRHKLEIYGLCAECQKA